MPLMKTAWFIVVRSAETWWVDFEGDSEGPYDDIDMAKIEAISKARAFDDGERQAIVYAPDEEGVQRPIFRGAQRLAGMRAAG
jgi:hypothetical protein